MALLVL